jgi:hypothetical protein
MLMALSLYQRSPAAYRLLCTIFLLPSVRSLRRWLQVMQFEPGFCSRVFQALETKTRYMSEIERMGVLCIDDMAVKMALEYDSRRDVVDGFQDDGVLRSGKPATEALVFTVKGLIKKWKQPLCYFLSGGSTSSSQLVYLVLDCIAKLQEIGIVIKVVVCDQGANNRGMFSSLGISIEKPYVEVNSSKVFFMYDPLHLLKSVRNNFKRYPVQLGPGKVARWDHVKKFYDLDSVQKVRLAPKLKLAHFLLNGFKEMNVRLAAQVMSHSAAVGMQFYVNLPGTRLTKDALVSADFLLMMDKIFDSCNGISFNDLKVGRRPVTRNFYHVDFWCEAAAWLQNLKFLGAKARIYCVDGWRLTLTCMTLLWQKVIAMPDVKFLLPRRLNQDCLESFFASVRQKGDFRDNPSCSHFRSTVRQSVANKLLSSFAGGNSEANDDGILLSLNALSASTDVSTPAVSPTSVPLHDVCVSFSPALQPKIRSIGDHSTSVNALTYVAGYVVQKILKCHSCEACTNLLCRPGVLQDETLAFMHLKAISKGDFGKLKVPSNEIVRDLQAVEAEFTQILPHVVFQQGVLAVRVVFLKLVKAF